MRKNVKLHLLIVLFNLCWLLSNAQFYTGTPWKNQAQKIPGKIQCEWYDLGGEGIAYHDSDSINHGSGKLNPANGTFLNEFRILEGVDISYTKPAPIDINPYNLVQIQTEQLYVGWTKPLEWINYTLCVSKSGWYTVGLMYTANGDGKIALFLDRETLADDILIPSTQNELETIGWRQWHHWNRIDSVATVKIRKGIHVLTLQTVENGNMNFDYIKFVLKKRQVSLSK
ncbi:MAG: hypothetical protein JNM57_03945 [Cyclobacteriaceae bacterium]|nr:hypothetical protein [Cyclobacteriaceae bacterium]